jgi:hypothetical protein
MDCKLNWFSGLDMGQAGIFILGEQMIFSSLYFIVKSMMISAIYSLKKNTLTTYKTIKVGHASNILLDESKKKRKEQWL